jgi:hypothetical protein
MPEQPVGVPDLYGRSAWVASTYMNATPDWHEKAECRGRDPEAWFPDPRKTLEEEIEAALGVKTVCASCPVVRECLEAGFQNQYSMEFGIWGGSTPLERQGIANHQDRIDVLLAELERQVGRSA